MRDWSDSFLFAFLLLSSRLPFQLVDDELDGSDRELDIEEGGDYSELQWGDSNVPRTSSRPASATAALIRADRSGRDTPASVDSIPLEWDHDYDLSRGLESPGGRGIGEKRSRGQEEDDEYLRTTATVLSGWSGSTHWIEEHLLNDLFWFLVDSTVLTRWIHHDLVSNNVQMETNSFLIRWHSGLTVQNVYKHTRQNSEKNRQIKSCQWNIYIRHLSQLTIVHILLSSNHANII